MKQLNQIRLPWYQIIKFFPLTQSNSQIKSNFQQFVCSWKSFQFNLDKSLESSRTKKEIHFHLIELIFLATPFSISSNANKAYNFNLLENTPFLAELCDFNNLQFKLNFFLALILLEGFIKIPLKLILRVTQTTKFFSAFGLGYLQFLVKFNMKLIRHVWNLSKLEINLMKNRGVEDYVCDANPSMSIFWKIIFIAFYGKFSRWIFENYSFGAF